jgi:hypothetical protein
MAIARDKQDQQLEGFRLDTQGPPPAQQLETAAVKLELSELEYGLSHGEGGALKTCS